VNETICTLVMPGLVFGSGASLEAGGRAAALGVSRALLVTHAFLAEQRLHEPVAASCRKAGVDVVLHLIPSASRRRRRWSWRAQRPSRRA